METIAWKNGKVRIIDQSKLPKGLTYINCNDIKTIGEAIKSLRVRGAPALGVAAAFGVYLGIRKSSAKKYHHFKAELIRVNNYLSKTRPTAKNLFWALEQINTVVEQNAHLSISELKKIILKEAIAIMNTDKAICRKMGDFGQSLLRSGDTVLTHCNAGALATSDFGTALGVIYRARDKGKKINVFADETRPLLQGSRLTTWELMRKKIKVTLICDNMAAKVIGDGKVNKILVGADRIARNGDTANKIGTYNLAILAKFHKIPFYVVAPSSTFDLSLKNGRDIPIEERDKEEVRKIGNQMIAPCKVGVYNPAFDVTPANLISAIISECGIIKPPYLKNIKKCIKK